MLMLQQKRLPDSGEVPEDQRHRLWAMVNQSGDHLSQEEKEPTPDVIAAEQQVPPVLVQKPPDELRRIQLEDGPVGLMLRAVEKTEKPTSEDARGHGPEAQRLKQLWTRLIVDDGVLKRRYEDTQKQSTWLQLVVPCPLRDEVLHELHAGALEGHLGEDFYWPGMQHDVRNWCRTCEACQTRKSCPVTDDQGWLPDASGCSRHHGPPTRE